jgi:hypothetical protein
MLPYRIGKLSKPEFDSPQHETAYEHYRDFLYSVCEIRNVFFLDVNIFSGGNESSGSPHSLAMRTKTHGKFVTSSLPMLEAAAGSCCEKLTEFSCARMILRDFREELLECFSSRSSDLILFIATELCQIEKEFLSSVVTSVADSLANMEGNDAYGFSNLQSLCSMTLEAMKRLLHSISTMPMTLSEAMAIQTALDFHDECFVLAKCGFVRHNMVFLSLHKGDTVFRSGDIIDLIYVVLEGTVVAKDDHGIELDCFRETTAFGALQHATQIDIGKNKLGNQVMAFTTNVASDFCRVAILHPLELLQEAIE